MPTVDRLATVHQVHQEPSVRPARIRGLGDVVPAIWLVCCGLLVAALARERVSGTEAVALGLAGGAVVIQRVAPGTALVLATCSGWVTALGGDRVSVAQLGLVVAAYGYGMRARRHVAWVAVPLLASVAVVETVSVWRSVPQSVLQVVGGPEIFQLGLLAALCLAPWLVAWLAGLLVASVAAVRRETWKAGVAAAESARAEQIAASERRRAELGRDVHDIVGHSLAAIISLADSARYRSGDDDPAALGRVLSTVATIAATARGALEETRDVLTRLAGPSGPHGGPGHQARHRRGAPALRELVETLRQAGLVVTERHAGEPQDLPAAIRDVVLAVERELLTNALRHGDRSQPIDMLHRWEASFLVVEVRNAVPAASGPADGPPSPGGSGIAGARARLDAVGGQLTASARPAASGEGWEFVATIRVPVATPDPDPDGDGEVSSS